MPLVLIRLVAVLCAMALAANHTSASEGKTEMRPDATPNFINAADFGFLPAATGPVNARALQKAVDKGGTVVVSQPGVYDIADTVYLGSHTSLVFGNGAFLRKVSEPRGFCHVLLNKGAVSRTWDEDITVSGLHIVCNGIDTRNGPVVGLHGQLAFSFVKDLRIERFRCLDLGKAQFAVHICTFENIVIEDVHIRGDKDGIHLGRGKGFTIRDGVFQTYDDAVALNGHDYSACNPQLGWIENGIVENCRDLSGGEKTVGFFCRLLSGAWIDWRPGMEVQQSDTVVSNGRVYRVHARPDGTIYTSKTRPTHEEGLEELDGIPWVMAQDEAVYTAGVRNVTFRDIFLEKPRTSFCVCFDNNKYSRSYYPEANVPQQEHITFENVQVLHSGGNDFLAVSTPLDVVNLANCTLARNRIRFSSNSPIDDYGPTQVNLVGCIFNHDKPMDLLVNGIDGKRIAFQTVGSVAMHRDFRAMTVVSGGDLTVRSDLPGLSD